jgi:hypothetical protein
MLAWRMVTKRSRKLARKRDKGQASGLRVQARSDKLACPRLSRRSKRDTPTVRLDVCFMLLSPDLAY